MAGIVALLVLAITEEFDKDVVSQMVFILVRSSKTSSPAAEKSGTSEKSRKDIRSSEFYLVSRSLCCLIASSSICRTFISDSE